jgi:diacylglycerol kinase (ATP)
MRVHLTINEHSRRGRVEGPAVRQALAGAGIEAVEQAANQSPADIDAIVCAGGDGTVMRAIATAVERKLPLGIVALGTFNELARRLEIPLEISAAVQTIAAGGLRAIDVGRVNGVHYLHEASIGLSSRIARLQTPELKQRFGFAGVMWTVLQAVRHGRPIRAHIEHDGGSESLKTVQLTVANSDRFGGVFNVADAAIDDGWLDLYSVDIRGPREFFAVAHAAFIGERRDAPGLRTLRSRAFTVTTRRAHRITADGEPAGTTPARFEILRKALRVFAPQ